MNPIILCSGGVDSLALVVQAVIQGKEPMLFHVQYEHPAAEKELEAVQRTLYWRGETGCTVCARQKPDVHCRCHKRFHPWRL